MSFNLSRATNRSEFEGWRPRPRYELRRSLGSGAYGKVAEALDR